MEALELLQLIQKGESSSVQFKERIEKVHELSQELVAFSNTKGGIIVIGVKDKTGDLNGLSFKEIYNTNQTIVNASTSNVIPSIIVTSETINVDDRYLMIIHVNEGISKPYKDRNGAIWVKNGSDKRRVTANEEIARFLQRSKIMFADEMPIPRATADEIDLNYYKTVFNKRYEPKGVTYDSSGLDLVTSLQNQQLYKNGAMTLVGLLVFCKNRHSFTPQFSVQCFSTNETNLLGNTFADNEPAFEGTLEQVYFQALNFIGRNMKKVPSGNSFNSELRWEIPKEVFEEIIVNTLLCKGLHKTSYVRHNIMPSYFVA